MKNKTVFPLYGLLVLLPFYTIMAMSVNQDNKEVPGWLQEKIGEIRKAPVANPPARMYKCTWQDKTVYYLPPQCCDKYGDLYDGSGGIICHPDGGITGRGDGRCRGFSLERDKCMLIWKDDRSYRKEQK